MKQKVSLVLGSGGAKGLAHIGVIEELEKQGFEISSISGSSIGSVYGGLYAMGKLSEYTKWVTTLDKLSIWDLMDFTISSNGLLKGEKVFSKMKTFIPDLLIENMDIPFTAVATDILNKKEVIFTSGSYYKAIRASVAIPTLITPVKFEDTFLVDGGVLNPVPIDYVKRINGDILVVVNLYGEKDNVIENPIIKESDSQTFAYLNGFFKSISKLISSGDKSSLGYFSLITATTSAMVNELAKHAIEKYQPDIVINIPHNSSNTFDFDKANKLIKLGRKAAKKEISNYLNSNK